MKRPAKHLIPEGKESIASQFSLLCQYETDQYLYSVTRTLRAYRQIKDWLFFPSCRSFLRGQMTTRGEARSVKKKDLGNLGCLLGIGVTPDSH